MTRLQPKGPESKKVDQELGRYRILERLGTGELGEVLLAGDALLGRRVALRVLPSAWDGDEERLRRLRSAVEAAAGLIHPNIVTVYGCEEARGKTFVVMELVSGRALSRLVRPEGLALARLVEVTIPIAEALAAAHERGIVHGDLRPGNVLVTRDGTVKVTDFCLAELRHRSVQIDSSQTDTKPLPELTLPVESISYRAPEQIRGGPPDRRSDIFSFGAVLCELATGRRPFGGESAPPVVAAILRDQPPPMAGPQGPLPRELARIIESCLQKDPDLRPPSALELRNELEDLGRRAGPAAPPPAGRERASGPEARPKWRWAAAGSVVAAVLVALVGVGLRREAPPVPEPIAVEPALPAEAAQQLPKRVAVLPFRNLGPQEDDFLAVGLAAEISRELASVEGLTVISPRSTVDLSATGPSAPMIGGHLGVDFVLQGTVQRGGDPKGRDLPSLTSRLSRVKDKRAIWTRADRDDPVQSVRSARGLARDVARFLVGGASGPSLRSALDYPTAEPVAFESYLRALDGMNRARGSNDLRQAAALLTSAVERDPEFLVAHATLSRLHAALGRGERGEGALQRARESLDRARRLGPTDPETRLAEAFYSWASGAEDRALEQFRAAARILPSSSDVRRAMGLILRGRGEWKEALGYLERSAQLDPRGPEAAIALVETLSRMRRFEDARRRVERAIASGPRDHRLLFLKSEILLRGEGDVEAARSTLRQVGPPHRDDAWQRRMLEIDLCARDYSAALERLTVEVPVTVQMALERAWLFRVANRRPEAEELYERIKHYLEGVVEPGSDDPLIYSRLAVAYTGTGRAEAGIGSARRATLLLPVTADSWKGPEYLSVLARVYAMAGERDAAIEELWYLLSIPSPVTVKLLELEPVWDPLRSEPRFRQLLGSGR